MFHAYYLSRYGNSIHFNFNRKVLYVLDKLVLEYVRIQSNKTAQRTFVRDFDKTAPGRVIFGNVTKSSTRKVVCSPVAERDYVLPFPPLKFAYTNL